MDYKVICIKNHPPGMPASYYDCLTIGKIYNATEIFEIRFVNYYLILDDNNEKCLYHKSNFEPLALYRDKKIDEIFNDGKE